MTKQEEKLQVGDKFLKDMDLVESVLDPHIKVLPEEEQPDKWGLWSWRNVLAIIVLASAASSIAVLAVISLRSFFWD